MCVVFPSACLLWATLAALAQSPETLEVASIKLGDQMKSGTSYYLEPGGIRIEGARLKRLILYAYDLREFQLTGAKGWMTSERYTIQAKGPLPDGAADYRKMTDRQQRAAAALSRTCLQALLADRFQLALHTETRELLTYALMVAKGGPKLKPNLSPDGSNQGITTGPAMFKATRASMEGIAQNLAGLTGRPVRDETGLTGYYDFDLEWTPDAPPAAPGAEGEKRPDSFGPTLFTALKEQFGLKLESRKGPVGILVIDRAERASEN